jgi:hypothetical protein
VIDDLPAGRELDALLEDRLFGRCVEWLTGDCGRDAYALCSTDEGGQIQQLRRDNGSCVVASWRRVPAYSTTWEGTGLVIQRMRELGYKHFLLNYCADYGADCWEAQFGEPEFTEEFAEGDDARAVVARAALKALEVR